MNRSQVIPIGVVQNVDRVVTAAFFEEAYTLFTTGIPFLTIQGEGPFAGRPAWFVRLAGCNYGDKATSERGPGMCAFCDTNFKIDEATKVSPEDLLMQILLHPAYDARQILVLTGGEPTLQKRMLLEFMRLAAPHFAAMQVETNGTQPGFFKDAEKEPKYGTVLIKTTIVVSPKATEITGNYTMPSLKVLDNDFQSTVLKFLISAEDPKYKGIPRWALDRAIRSPGSVYVSPIAVYKKPYAGEVSSAWDHDLIDAAKTAANYNYAATYAVAQSLKLSIQQHLFCAIA